MFGTIKCLAKVIKLQYINALNEYHKVMKSN